MRRSEFLALFVVLMSPLVSESATTTGNEWPGDIKLAITNQEDYVWSVRLYITNNDARAASGFLLKLRLKNPENGALELKSETNVDIDSSGANIGTWSLRAHQPFGLSGNGAVYSGSSFKIVFNGPLYGHCIGIDLLQPDVTLFAPECSESSCPATCGDGACNSGETCATCPIDCLRSSSELKCAGACGDGLCSHGESDQTCPEDCQAVVCKAPFQFIFGWNLNTTLLAAGVLMAILFGLISGLCFKYKIERQQLLAEETDKNHQATLRRIPAPSEYDESVHDLEAAKESSVVKPAPPENIYAEYDEEVAHQHIPIASKANIFYERPWINPDVASSSDFTTRSVSAASPSVASIRSDAELSLALAYSQAEPRVPGYLQDMAQLSPAGVEDGLRKRLRLDSQSLQDAPIMVTPVAPSSDGHTMLANQPT